MLSASTSLLKSPPNLTRTEDITTDSNLELQPQAKVPQSLSVQHKPINLHENKRGFFEIQSQDSKSQLPLRKFRKLNENSHPNNSDDFKNSQITKQISGNFQCSNKASFSRQTLSNSTYFFNGEGPNQKFDSKEGFQNINNNDQTSTNSSAFVPNMEIREEVLYINEQLNQPTFSSGLLDTIIEVEERILVLDLDNTLVHSYFGVVYGEGYGQIESDSSITFISPQNHPQTLMVKRRAYLKEFLELAFQNFQVILYTLGTMAYAQAVHDIFKKNMPEIFSKHRFFRIIAQETTRSSTSQNQKKDLSRYFSFSKFQNRLLILDDNSTVYSSEWQRNIIFTKPFNFWHPEGIAETVRNSSIFSEDYFLYFVHRLVSQLLQKDPFKKNIVRAYIELQMSLLQEEVVHVSHPAYQNALTIAVKMGAQIANENPHLPQTAVIIGKQENLNNIVLDDPNNAVTEDWLTCCFVFGMNIPKILWHQVKGLPNLEIALASLL